MKNNERRCGYVSIVGRPNVGKSTLLNALIGEKISIVSSKAHTTRDNILGILNIFSDQIIFIDTPGLQLKRKSIINQLMAKSINQAIIDSDLIVLMIEASRINKQDYIFRDTIGKYSKKAILVINKIDTIKNKDDLLPLLSKLHSDFNFLSYIPISARNNINLKNLVEEIRINLPIAPILFSNDLITDKDRKFRIEEIIREKVMINIHEEVPYGLKVQIEHMSEERKGVIFIHAVILVDKESHKPILIGKNGKTLKHIGTLARKDINRLFGIRSHIELWVKAKDSWSSSRDKLSDLDFNIEN
ncbi:MAG: GTPase Era [Gammaproteobacteria bacterium TMED78]|nr:MAG: GTPase Era [Gammaproteobacteria bacterium TMED78]|tara:strand:- start:81575 stop:82480 length:906 start_codon:yes stop_codon:yes gene_type:complete